MRVWSEHQTILTTSRSITEFPWYIANSKFHFRSDQTIACSCLYRNALAQILGRVHGRSAVSSNRPCGGIHANKSASARLCRISALETSVLLPAACSYSFLVERKRSILVNQTGTARPHFWNYSRNEDNSQNLINQVICIVRTNI